VRARAFVAGAIRRMVPPGLTMCEAAVMPFTAW